MELNLIAVGRTVFYSISIFSQMLLLVVAAAFFAIGLIQFFYYKKQSGLLRTLSGLTIVAVELLFPASILDFLNFIIGIIAILISFVIMKDYFSP